MIGFMRRIAPTVMWIVIIAFVGTIFFAWGMDFVSSNRFSQHVGQIDEKKITYKQFLQDVEVERERLRTNTESEVNQQQEQMIPRQVWEREVSKALHTKVVSEMALEGTSEEVFEYIKKNPPPQVLEVPQFQTDSVFDTAKFVQFLNTPESYDNPGMVELEMYTKNMIIPVEKLRIMLEKAAVPTKGEIEYEYRSEKERAVFEFAKVSTSAFSIDSSEITPAMKKTYYETHPDSFKTEERAELYYVKIPKLATVADEQSYIADLKEIRQNILSGSSTFAEEAKIESDDEGSAGNGGELGWFTRGQMVGEFEDAAFSTPPGSISEPVKTNYGYHLIMVDEVERATPQPVEPIKKSKKSAAAPVEKKPGEITKVKARHILRKIKPSAETLDSLDALAESIRQKMMEMGFKAGAAQFPDLRVDSTDLFKRGEMIKGIGYLTAASRYAFASAEKGIHDSISEKMENEQAYFLAALKRKVPKGILAMVDVDFQIRAALKDSLQANKARDYLEKVKASLPTDKRLATLKETDSLIVSATTDTVSRKQYIPEIGYDNAAVTAAFVLPNGTLSNVLKVDRSFYLVRPLWKNTLDSIPWTSDDIPRIKEQLVQQKQRSIYMDWYVSYKNTMNISDNLNEFFN